MGAVGTTRGRHYRVVPHFRVEGTHADDCDWEGLQVDIATAEPHEVLARRNLPGLEPVRLRLVERRPHVAPDAAQFDPGRPKGLGAAGHGGEAAAGAHDAVAGTLHRIAEAYLAFPYWRDRPLEIPGCDGKTYAECFSLLQPKVSSD